MVMKAQKLLFNSKGQSIVEITLITPLLLAALYVAFDFGIALFTSHLTQNAVREAARISAILPDCSVVSGSPTPACVTAAKVGPVKCTNTDPVVQEVCTRLPVRLKENDPDITVTLTGTVGAECRRMITVNTSGNYSYGLYNVMALIGVSNPKTLTINRSANARYELQPITYTVPCT
jgi:Flp pilus assembly protein TadG